MEGIINNFIFWRQRSRGAVKFSLGLTVYVVILSILSLLLAKRVFTDDVVGVQVHDSRSSLWLPSHRNDTTASTISSKRGGGADPLFNHSSSSIEKNNTGNQTQHHNKTLVGSTTNKTGRNRQLLLILHVGPHKTATSAIQCQFTHHMKLLKESNYVYSGRIYQDCLQTSNTQEAKKSDGGSLQKVGRFNPRTLVKCLDDHNDENPCNESTRWKDVEIFLQNCYQNDMNVIISDEAFSRLRQPQERSIRLLHQLFTTSSTNNQNQKYNYHVRVVIGYRRYHEWVTSSYNHYVAGSLKNGKFPTHYLYRQGVLEHGFSKDYSYFKKQHPTEYLRTLYESKFDDVRIFNIHRHIENYTNNDTEKEQQQKQKPSSYLMTNYFRQIMDHDDDDDQLNALSPVLSSMEAYESPHLNQGSSWKVMSVLTLAMAAQHYKLVTRDNNNKEQQKKRIIFHIADAIKTKTLPSLYLDCLTDEEENEFLNRSLTFEQQLIFPSKPTDDDDDDDDDDGAAEEDADIDQRLQYEEEHRAKFASAKHCSVDIEKVVRDPEWKSFFQSI